MEGNYQKKKSQNYWTPQLPENKRVKKFFFAAADNWHKAWIIPSLSKRNWDG